MPDTMAPVPPAAWNQNPRVLALQESHNEYGSRWIRRLGSVSASGWPQSLLLLAALLLALRAYRQGRTLPVRRVSVDSVVLGVLSQIFRFSALVFIAIAAAETSSHIADSVVVGAVFGFGLSGLLPSTRWRQGCLAVVNMLLVGSFVLLAVQELLPWFEIRPAHQHNTMAILATLSLGSAVLAAMVTPKAWSPPAHLRPAWAAADEESPIGPSPEETASFVSRYCWYGWLSPLVYKSFASDAVIGMDDLPCLPWYDEPKLLLARMSRAREGGRRTLDAVFRFLSWELAAMAVWVALAAVFELVVPLAMFNFSAYFESPQAARLRPSFWIALGFASYLLRSQTSQQYIFTSTRLCVRLKSGMTQELYQTAMASMELSSAVIGDLVGKKSAKPKPKPKPPGAVKGKSSKTTPAGQLANLMSSDIDAIFKARDFVTTVVSVPISCFFICLGLYQLHGWPALAGFAVMLLSIALPLKMATWMSLAQRKVKRSQDHRISLISEYINLIRPIKYFAWEDMVAKRIHDVRVKEQARLWTAALMQALTSQLAESIPVLAVIVILACHVCVVGEPLSAAGAFTTVYLTTTLRGNLVNLGSMWRKGQNAWISVGRLDTFFGKITPLARYPEGPLRLRNASFRKGAFTVDNITLDHDDIVEGGLHVLSGDSGSGKTTLLQSILGEVGLVEHDEETRRGTRVTRPSSAVYASQTPWLMNMTIKDNIVFHADFDHERYNRVVTACCLDDDLMVLPKGGMTMVGENGSALSRGQRARVALARALYAAKEGSLVLLDDIFAALDSRTINQVWQRCFCSDLLRGRTVILATRLEQVLSQCDRHFAMDGGQIVARDRRVVSERQSIDVPAGHPDGGGDEGAADVREEAAAMRDGAAATETSVHHAEPAGAGAESGPSTRPPANLKRQLSVRLIKRTGTDDIRNEMAASQGSGRKMVLGYMQYFGTPGYIAAVLGSTVMAHLAYMASSRWLAHWVSAYQDGLATPSSPRAAHYLGVFALLCSLEAAFALTRLLLFARGAWVAARRLHAALVAAVLGAPLGWHDATPAGRVVNRLSRDVDSLDTDLNRTLMTALGLAISTAVRLLAVTAVLPVFVAPAMVFGALGGLAGEMYTRAAVPAKRLVSSSQSPVFSLMGDTLAGLAVIRATRPTPRGQGDDDDDDDGNGGNDDGHDGNDQGGGALFQDLLADRLRDYSRAMEANYNLNRWVAVRVDLAAACIMLFAGVIALFFGTSVPAAMIAFSMSQATGLGETILKLVRSTNDLEVELQSFARVREYTEIKPEDADEAELDPEPRPSWPEHGGVVFDRATVRYRPDGPDILRDVSFAVAPGERCAVVGRTGSGKSTLMLSLMRFTHVASGAVTYGGVDVSAVPRRVLRSRLTVIPQEAVLLAGSVRSNLDPTGEVPDADLDAALAECARSASLSHLVVAGHAATSAAAAGEGDVGGNSSGPAFREDHAEQEEDEEEDEEPSERTALLGKRPASTAAAAAAAAAPAPAQAARTTGLSLDGEVEPAGANFSHGQRQILSLCRAVVRSRSMRPPGRLMMLDEATASMDDKADEMAQDVLRRELARGADGGDPGASGVSGGRTLITIAHRLSTIMDYDKVIVMDQGAVKEIGVPRELENKPGSLFAEMVLAERLRSEGAGRKCEFASST